MSAGKIIASIVAAILILFGVLMIIGATNDPANYGWIPVAIVIIGIGLVLVFFATRKPAQPTDNNVTLNIDLPGNVNMDTIKCEACGGTLKPEDITMVAGAPVVTCPWCNTTYQLTEEPKW